jgi:hypothetical protein
MRTTLDVPKQALDELLELVDASTKGEAVTIAIEDFIKRKKSEQLKAASGKIRLADNWRELEKAELEEAKNDFKRRR